MRFAITLTPAFLATLFILLRLSSALPLPNPDLNHTPAPKSPPPFLLPTAEQMVKRFGGCHLTLETEEQCKERLRGARVMSKGIEGDLGVEEMAELAGVDVTGS